MKNQHYQTTVFSVAALITIVAAIHIYLHGTDEEAVRLLIRWTARISAFLFVMAFGAASLQYFFKDSFTAMLVKYRPHLGLAFGVSHTFHLSFLIWLQYSIHPVFTLAKKTSLLGGGMAYLFMYAMMLTTFPKWKEKLSASQWKTLHLVGGYWIWFIFFRSYTRKVLLQDQGYVLFALLVLIFITRLLQQYHKRRMRLHPV